MSQFFISILIVSIVLLLFANSRSEGASAYQNGDATSLIPRAVLFGNPQRAGVEISPDGKWIGYLAPLDGVLNVWIEPVDGGEARAITTSADRPIQNYTWARNGDQILYMQDKGGDENNHVYAVNIDDLSERDLTPFENTSASLVGGHRDRPDEVLIQMNNRNPQFMDLHRVNTRSGNSEMIFQNDEGFVGMIPDDDWVVRARTRMTPDGGTFTEVRDSIGGDWYEFAAVGMEDAMTTSPAGFSKDGSVMYMIDSRGRNTAAAFKVKPDAAGNHQSDVIYSNEKADVSDFMSNPISGEPEAAASEHLRKNWTVLDPAIDADITGIGHLNEGDFEVISRSGDDRTWIVAYEQDAGPVAYYLWDRDTQAGRFLFTNRPELESLPLAHMTPVEIEARDGLTMTAYLTLPKGVESGPLPMVLLVHGGPWARDHWGYNSYHQWLANRGYAVLSVNFRGSTGFGKDFLNAGNRQWAGEMQNDLIDACEWAVAEGVADPNRIAIMGGSYGGYATLVGMTDTPEYFAAGVDIVGPSHVGTLLATIPPYWAPMVAMFESRVAGTDETEYLDQISPLTRVDQIRRPLLIGQGANDPRVKLSESDQIVSAMQSRDLPVTYVVFPDEGHGFRKPENNQAFNAVTETFLAKHLGGRSQPISEDVTNSTAQIRSLGNLEMPGIVIWEPSEEQQDDHGSQVADSISVEDLTDDQRAEATQQLDAIYNQVPDEMLPAVLAQLEQQEPMVPDADKTVFLYMVQQIEARVAAQSSDEDEAATLTE
ncbi:MAG: S9 family peptidase [Phycisphaerales bacterium]|nr:S9 family peptidase [Phycisphaerales bacterium]